MLTNRSSVSPTEKKHNFVTLLSKWLAASEDVQHQVLSEARRMAGPAVSRRVLIGALAVAPAAALPAEAENLVPVENNIPSGTLVAYNLDYAPLDRVKHHILMASLALQEIAAKRDAQNWSFVVGGNESGLEFANALTATGQATETVWFWHV